MILGRAGWPYHLEFTRRRIYPVAPRPTDEDLLVFYLADRAGWDAAVQRVRDFGHAAVSSSNPYWDRHGLTFEDPDGYRVVLAHVAWS